MTANVTLCTAPSPGAIGLIQIHGSSARAIVEQLTGVCEWPIGRTRLVRFADIDRGLAVRLTEHTFQLMPHSGPRVVRDLLAALDGLGATGRASGPGEIYPEAKSDLEADLLGALAAAASPAAVDLLLDQPVRWGRWLDHPERWDTTAVLEHSAVLDRLLDPPTVVVVGKPNVGKSTLLNRLVGRTASVVADLPGTTRDWVGSLVELIAVSNHDEGARGAVAVRWLDTPGIRISSDPVEGEAMRIAHRVIRTADLLIAMRDPGIGWLDDYPGGRNPGLWVMNKADTLGIGDEAGSPDGRGPQSPLNISAKTGAGLDLLQRGIIERLGLGLIGQGVPWAFSGTLKACVGSGDQRALAFYMGPG